MSRTYLPHTSAVIVFRPLICLILLLMAGPGGELSAQNKGSAFLVYDTQDDPGLDNLYRYNLNSGNLTLVGSAGYDNVNGLAYYCEDCTSADCRLYAMQSGRTITLFPPAIPEVQLLEYDLSGGNNALGPLSSPPVIPPGMMMVSVSSPLYFIVTVFCAGIYYLAGVAVKVNLLTFELLDYRLYVGEIDLNNITMTA